MESKISKQDNCTFCHPNDDLKSRIINQTEDFTSFMSKPRFRLNHVLVVPTNHYETLFDAPESTLGKIMGEVALLASCIDTGYGTITAQKFQPLQGENGIKMNHLHIHAWPRTIEDEQNGVLMPAPQSFEDFETPDAEDLEGWLRIIKPHMKIARLRRQGVPMHEIGNRLSE